jgi:fibro-slime domain-containing protein
VLALCVCLATAGLAPGCASVRPAGGAEDGPDGGASEDAARADVAMVPEVAPEVAPVERPPRESGGGVLGCGTRKIDVEIGEACDDGNTRGGDGCAADCKSIEKDFACPEPGMPCTYLVKCGDGVLGGNERCDPPSPGGGCAADCTLEPGYVCDPPGAVPDPTQPARCHRTVCGDGNREGTEACDDANDRDGDGCAAACTLEPDCSDGGGACASKCGDGMKLAPEGCDDGNTADGDGCSSACAVETGFTCTDTSSNPPPRLNLMVTYRDFISFPTGGAARHADFEIYSGMDVTPLLVEAMLGADGKPAMEGRCAADGVSAACPYDRQLASRSSFAEWYRDVPGVNVTVSGLLLLPRLAGGSYVFDSGGAGFYPIDGRGWIAAPARETVATADPVVNDGRPHNFGFTTEIRYFFQYRGGEALAFSGDDDVWIFLNRRLALDLGGLHPRTQRALDVDQRAAALGLAVGGLYEIVLFHAERHSAGSNFKLTLTGFAPTSSACRSVCGDGLLAPSSEQCDDGNTADEDGCSHDCRFEIVIN